MKTILKIIIYSLIVLNLSLGLTKLWILYSYPYSDSPTLIPHLNAVKLSLLINNWRLEHNLQTLTNNQILCNLANKRAFDVQTDWSHNKFYPDVYALPYNAYFGENLIKGFPSEQEAYQGWIDSPKHLDNIKNPLYTQACIVCKYLFCVQEFSSPLSQ